jgi:hypothetical protein
MKISSLLMIWKKLPVKSLTGDFYNNRPKTQILIMIVSKLAENFTKNNSKYIMKCVILSLNKQKIIWTLSSIFVQAPPVDFCKNTSMKKIQTHRYSLKYKEINMQICQLWSVVNFFVKN